MSTSLLYHGFGVRGYRYVKAQYTEGAVSFTISHPRKKLYRCPACGSEDVIGRGRNVRRFHTVPIGRKRVYLVLAVPRVQCRCCGVVRQVKLGFADPRYDYTRAFERYTTNLKHR